MYINQLSQEIQDFIKQRLQANLQAEGLTGLELAEAIQDGLDSKLDDLGEHLTHDERKGLLFREEYLN